MALSLLQSFAGCGGSYSERPPSADLSNQKKTNSLNEALMLSAAMPQGKVEEEYRIGPEDLLEIEAYNLEELKKTVRVNSQGDIALPLVGIMNVKGLTPPEVERLITERLDRYVEETVVTVYVKEYQSQKISVVGAVKNAQLFPITGQKYLLDMIMMAGGLAPEAGNICYLIRPTTIGGKAATIVIDLEELLLKGNTTLNIPVFSGDVINIPRGAMFFVDGAVKTPGAYTMRGRTSLVQAISMAQGPLDQAALGDVRIFRENSSGEREILKADYGDIKNGNKPDILLAENDIVIVPESGIKNFFNGFVSVLKGFVTFGTRTF